MPAPPMRVAVLGPGGVGGLVAALLAAAGTPVTCLASEATATAIRERGLRLHSARFGDVAVTVAATTRLAEPVDACLVAVKATQLEAALERLPPDVLGTALLVPLLNGVEHLGLLRARYPDAAVAAGSISVGATRVAPGEIRHDSDFASVELATADPRAEVAVGRLADLLARAGLDVDVRDDEAALLWDKLAFLAPMALLTTCSRAPVGTVRAQHRDDLEAVVVEVAAVARAEGGAGDAGRVIRMLDAAPAELRSSMQRDAEAGRPMELDAIGGAVLRAAARHGIPVPVTARYVAALQSP
jgi:2-dehydropantoate 2-reductase